MAPKAQTRRNDNIIRWYQKDFDYKQIGKVFHMEPNAVRMVIYRWRKKIGSNSTIAP